MLAVRLTLLLCLAVPSFAFAGSLPAGAGCKSSNDCRSQQCFEHRCAPSCNTPEGVGGVCSVPCQCTTRACEGGRCKPAPAPGAARAPSRGSSPTPRDEPPPLSPPEEQHPEDVPYKLPPVNADECGRELAATMFAGKSEKLALRQAQGVCDEHSREDIAKARQLHEQGYGLDFRTTVDTVAKATPEELACTRQALKGNVERNSPIQFRVPKECRKK